MHTANCILLRLGLRMSRRINKFFCSFQFAFLEDVLQGLSSTSTDAPDSSDSSGDESAGEEERKEEVDEDDQAEREKLSEYDSKFKVGWHLLFKEIIHFFPPPTL